MCSECLCRPQRARENIGRMIGTASTIIKKQKQTQVYVAKIPRILNDGRFLSPSSPTSSHSTKCEPQTTPLSMICNLKFVQGKNEDQRQISTPQPAIASKSLPETEDRKIRNEGGRSRSDSDGNAPDQTNQRKKKTKTKGAEKACQRALTLVLVLPHLQRSRLAPVPHNCRPPSS